MKAITKRQLYRGALLFASAFCLVEGLIDFAITIPFRRHYFPDERHPNGVLQATLFLVAAAIFLLEGCFLLLSRRLGPAT